MAVAAGRAADPSAGARRVVFVTRDFPLFEGGNGAVLLAGLSLGADVPVSEILGGAPAVLDEILAASAGTLIIAADDADTPAGAAAVLVGAEGADMCYVARQNRSLPVVARRQNGCRYHYGDPRLQREVGIRGTLGLMDLDLHAKIAAVCGVPANQLGPGLDVRGAVEDPTASATALIRVLAASIDNHRDGLVVAAEQSSITVAALSVLPTRIGRDERSPRELPALRTAPGTGMPISLAAYARAFEPKLRWEAAIFEEQPGVDSAPQFPPRTRVALDGSLAADYRLEPLPRTGIVYTRTTVALPVPDLPSPYELAVVQLDGSPVRVLLKVTGVPAGECAIGQAGRIVLRRIATRAGIPDYGYAFLPTAC